jgi:hypothetical protein
MGYFGAERCSDGGLAELLDPMQAQQEKYRSRHAGDDQEMQGGIV